MGRCWISPASALCCLAFGSSAHAADQAPPASSLPRWLLFSGTDAAIRSVSGWLGADFAPDGLDSTGPRLRGVAGFGSYRAGHPTLSGVDIGVEKHTATVSFGHAWITPLGRAALFAGGELDARAPDDAAAASSDRGTRGGAAVSAEVWAAPTPDIQATASTGFGTARSSWAVRASVCSWIGSLCLGQEAAAVGDLAGSELRFGIAITGLSFGATETRLAGGFARKTDGEDGGYGFITVWRRF